MTDQQPVAGDSQTDAERTRIVKMQEENERLRYRVKILENAVKDINKAN